MTKLVPILFLLCFAFSNSNAQHNEGNTYYILSDSAYAEAIAADSIQIIDVRTPMEYNRGHIERATNISYLGFSFSKKAAKLDKNKPTYIYCQTEHRSPLAAKVLLEMGFTEVYDLDDGFKAWQEAGMPITQ